MNKKTFGLAVIVVSLLLYFLIKIIFPSTEPYIIKEGNFPLTVQFISDTPGMANITKKNDTLFLSGKTISNDSIGYLYLDGYIETNLPDSFTLNGSIKMYAFERCCELIEKKGKWTFRRMENRNFFRLKERDSLCGCDTCCIYMDIHLK
jgi:hypothetical protein